MNETEKRNLAASVKENFDKKTEVQVNVRTKNGVKLPPNIMVFQTFAYLAATRLKPASNKVLMLFFANSAYENYIGMDILAISEKLDISERQVARAIKELKDNNIIISTNHPSDKRRNDYFLNPHSAWKGNSVSRKKLMQIVPDNQLSLFGINSKQNSEREKIEIRSGKPYLGE